MAITWNPADKNASVTLSGGNLTASATPASTGVGALNARATAAVGDGKWAFQAVYSSINDNEYDAIGLCNASASLNDNLGNNTHGIGFYLYGYMYGNTVLTSGLTQANVGDTITIAWSKSGSTVLVWVRVNAGNWNNNASANPATGAGGLSVGNYLYGDLYACFGVGIASTGGTTTATADFDGPFTLPSGFSYYDVGSGTQTLSPSLLTNSSTFYAPTVTRGARTLAPALLTNSSTIYAQTVTARNTLAAPLLTNAQALHSPTVAPGAVAVLAPLHANGSVHYGPTIAPGAVWLAPALHANASTLYGPTVSQGGLTLAPPLLTNASAFHAPAVSLGAVSLSPGLLANGSVLHPPTVTLGGATRTLEPARFDNLSTLFSPTVAPGAAMLGPPSLANVSSLHPPTVYRPGAAQALAPSRLQNVAAIFRPTVANDNAPGTYPLALGGSARVVRTALSGGGAIAAGFLFTPARVILTRLRGRP